MTDDEVYQVDILQGVSRTFALTLVLWFFALLSTNMILFSGNTCIMSNTFLNDNDATACHFGYDFINPIDYTILVVLGF